MHTTLRTGVLALALLGAACGGHDPEGAEATADTEIDIDAVPANDEHGPEPTEPEATEIYVPVPPVVVPGSNGAPPSDAIVLFDGSGFDHWISAVDSTAVRWHLNGDGSMTVRDGAGDIQTVENFGCVQLHVEWRSPAEIGGDGQARANSGVYLQRRYEIQVLDNNDNPTYVNGQVGAIYKQSVPLAMASVPSGAWNAYDIIYHAPDFDGAGRMVNGPTMTVLHNGVHVLRGGGGGKEHRVPP